ncbi:MAG: hypothetical protein Q8S54_19675 [Bacteroidota bacterium]|nr:hypothetical protein [Bacteroidota bacterium]
MITGKFIENSLGDFIGFEYDNGFVFKGEFNSKNPFNGDIFNPAGKNIYHGQISGDIFEYFIEYNETGKIKKRPFLPQ